jgi:hypothetical protein
VICTDCSLQLVEIGRSSLLLGRSLVCLCGVWCGVVWCVVSLVQVGGGGVCVEAETWSKLTFFSCGLASVQRMRNLLAFLARDMPSEIKIEEIQR